MQRQPPLDRDAFLARYTPDYQLRICGDLEECFFGDYPTLAAIRGTYGENMPVAWLIPQLYNLSAYCGCNGKMNAVQLRECAYVIATEFYYLKISEMMLFFHRFKSGKYGRFYGAADPLVITTSLREFLHERAESYNRQEQKEREMRKKAERGNTMSWEEYSMKTYGEIRPNPLGVFK